MLMVRTVIWLPLLLAPTYATQYECLPHPDKNMCIIDFIQYHPGGEPITFPTGFDQYSIMSRSNKHMHSNVTILDAALYEAMHRPTRLEMANICMGDLILPPELQLGIFPDNLLSSVSVETGQNYQISYLDLEHNLIEEIAFINVLVNLEVLHLEYNDIAIISGSIFASLTKLKYLYLQYNKFTSIPWNDLPRTIVHLDCNYGHVESAEFTNVSLPSLEYLGLLHNDLTTINVTALLLVAPRLKEAHLINAHNMVEHERDQIMATLKSSNISIGDSPWPKGFCTYDDQYEYEDGRCVLRQVGTGKAVLLSGVVIGMGATFVYIVVLTFGHMNR